MQKKIEVSNTFKKNYKKIEKKYRKKLDDYTETLSNGDNLPPAARDHSLNGRMKDYRSFKLDNNLRVIYQLFSDTLVLVDIGTHGVYESTLYEKLSAYMKKSSQLNPLLFEGNKLKSEIKDKILEIVDAFLEYAEVDIRVLDIRLVGSNAAYNYNEYSDLDVHIVTDLSEVSDPEQIARLYFDSVKSNFNKSYDIKIKGIDVELYVEDLQTSSMSNGIYSVVTDTWIKEPVESVTPTAEELADAERIADEILQSIENVGSIEALQDIVDRIYLMRKNSLSAHGETGAGNLAFKSLRNDGILDKVKDVLKNAKAKELSLESKSLYEDNEWQGGYPWDDLFFDNAKRFGLDIRQETVPAGDKELEFDYVILKSPTVFFHATSPANVDKIREEGLRAQASGSGKYVSGVFLSGSKEGVSKWRGANTVVLKVILPRGTKVYQDRQSNAVFIREDVPASLISR